MAQFYDERIVQFIKDNKTSFPLYTSSSDNNVNPSKNTYFSGVYLGGRNIDECTDSDLNE